MDKTERYAFTKEEVNKIFSDKIGKPVSRIRFSSRRLQKMFSARAKWQDNLYDNLVSKVIKILIRNKVSKVYVGDVAHILDDNNIGRLGNRMLHNYWAFDIIYHKLTNKCEEYGIEMERQDESYTSQTCPVCGIADEANKKDRIFLCGFCGWFGDRDLVGAENILINGMHSPKCASVRDSTIGGKHYATT